MYARNIAKSLQELNINSCRDKVSLRSAQCGDDPCYVHVIKQDVSMPSRNFKSVGVTIHLPSHLPLPAIEKGCPFPRKLHVDSEVFFSWSILESTDDHSNAFPSASAIRSTAVNNGRRQLTMNNKRYSGRRMRFHHPHEPGLI
jgi:hypothetical protein